MTSSGAELKYELETDVVEEGEIEDCSAGILVWCWSVLCISYNTPSTYAT